MSLGDIKGKKNTLQKIKRKLYLLASYHHNSNRQLRRTHVQTRFTEAD